MIPTTYKLTNLYFIMDSIGLKKRMSKVTSGTAMLGFLGRSQSFFWSHMTIKYHIQNLIYMCSKIGIAGKLASRECLRLKKTIKGHFTSQRPLQSLKLLKSLFLSTKSTIKS